MAVRSNDGHTEFIFDDPQVPCLQMRWINLWTTLGESVQFGVYQNNDEWGLTVDRRREPSEQDLHRSAGYRVSTLDDLPLGVVRQVSVFVSDRGDLAEIELDVDEQFLLLVAGETYETSGDEIEFGRYDESVLVFRSRVDYDSLDWKPPNPPRRLERIDRRRPAGSD